MSKKKSTNATAKKTVTEASTTVETPVVEEVKDQDVSTTETTSVEEEVVSETEETKVEESVETPVVEEVKTEEPVVETPTETIKEEEIKPEVVEAPVVPEEVKVEEVKPLPEEEQITPVTEHKSGKKEISGSKADIQIELSKKYKVKFAQSYFMKICASSREISLFSIIETWMVNKNAYVGLLSLDDLAHIREVVEGNTVTYKYKVLSPEVKKAFLEKLEFNTQYAVSHK